MTPCRELTIYGVLASLSTAALHLSRPIALCPSGLRCLEDRMSVRRLVKA